MVTFVSHSGVDDFARLISFGSPIMKHALAALLVLFCVNSAQAQWNQVASSLIGPVATFGGGSTFKDGIAWIGNQGLFMSSDSGLTWIDRSPNDQSTIMHVNFYDQNTGLVSCYSGGVYLTHDQGRTWNMILQLDISTSSDFDGSPNDIIATQRNPGNTYSSRDGGLTWETTQVDVAGWVRQVIGSTNGKAMILHGNFNTNSHVATSTDYGVTWKDCLTDVVPDCFSFAVDFCDPNRIYVINEDYSTNISHNAISQIYLTTDGGSSWSSPVVKPTWFFEGWATLAGSSVFCPTVDGSQTLPGVYRSTNRGNSWKSIGGPSGVGDTRLLVAINDNIVIAPDVDGNIWRTTNGGGDSVVIPARTTAALVAILNIDTLPPCGPINGKVRFAIGCGVSSVVVEKASLSGSSSFQVVNPGQYPRNLSPDDSVVVAYNGSHGISDTAYLTIQTQVDGSLHDTTITLLGSSFQSYFASPIPSGTKRVSQGDPVLIPLTVTLPVSLNPNALTVEAITYSLAYNSTLIDMIPSKVKQLITPPVGWIVSNASITTNALMVTLANPKSLPIQQPLECGSALFTAFTSPDNSTVVSLSSLELTLSSGILRFCSDLEGDFVATVVVSSNADVALSSHSMPDFRIFPNPLGSFSPLHCSISLPVATSIQATILDVLGRVQLTSSLGTLSQGSHNFDLRTEALNSGTYYCRISTALGTQATKFCVLPK